MFEVTIDELYRRVALINGVNEKDIERHMQDPDLRLLLSLLQQYAMYLTMELEQQENKVHENLMQRLAEYLFRPIPSVAILTYEDDSADTCDRLVKGQAFTLLSNDKSLAFSCSMSSGNWLAPENMRWDENNSAFSVELCLLQPMGLGDVLDKLSINGIFLLWPKISPSSVLMLNAVATKEIKTATIHLYGEKPVHDTNLDNQKKQESSQFLGELELILSGDLPTVVSCENDTRSNIPEVLYNYFLYPECYNGILCYLPPQPILRKEEKNVITRLSIQIDLSKNSRQVNGGEITNGLVNPLIGVGVREESIIPFKLACSEERIVNVRNGLSDNEEIHRLQKIDCRVIGYSPLGSRKSNSGKPRSSNISQYSGNTESEKAITGFEDCFYPIRKLIKRHAFRSSLINDEADAIVDICDFSHFAKTRTTLTHLMSDKDKELDCYLSISLPVNGFAENSNEILIGGEVSIAQTAVTLSSQVDLLLSSPNNEKVYRMKTRLLKNGMLAKKPLNAKLTEVLGISDTRKLLTATTEYINQLLFCSNRDYLDAKNSEISQLRCSAASVIKSYSLNAQNHYIGYELTIKLNMLLEECPLLQILAIGISRQVNEIFNPGMVLVTRIYDTTDNLLVRSINES